eukprot:15339913-Ditylum_brightwellii.AAC.1
MGSYWDHPLHDEHSQQNSQLTLLQQLTENFGQDIKDGICLSFTEQTNNDNNNNDDNNNDHDEWQSDDDTESSEDESEYDIEMEVEKSYSLDQSSIEPDTPELYHKKKTQTTLPEQPKHHEKYKYILYSLFQKLQARQRNLAMKEEEPKVISPLVTDTNETEAMVNEQLTLHEDASYMEAGIE